MKAVGDDVRKVGGTPRDASRSHRNLPKRTTYASVSLQQAPCPVCGKYYSLRHIEQHADRCANQKFLDDPPRGASETVSEPATSGPKISNRVARGTKKGTKRGRKPNPPKIVHDNTPAAAGAELLLHVALGTFAQRRETSEQSHEDSRENSSLGEDSMGYEHRSKPSQAQTAGIRRQQRARGGFPSQRSSTGSHSNYTSVKFWQTHEGEAVQFRGMPAFHTMAIPPHLMPMVQRAEDKLKALPNDAVFITTTKGALDKRKTHELRELIREEEYQLELYGSARRGKRRSRAPHKKLRVPRVDLSAALIEAAEASAHSNTGAVDTSIETLPPPANSELQTENGAPPKLLMRVRISNSGFYCEHSRNGSLIATSSSGRNAADAVTIDEDDAPLSDNKDERFGIPQMPLPHAEERAQLDRRSNRYLVNSNNKTAGETGEDPIPIDGSDEEMCSFPRKVPAIRRQPSNQDALDYVSRMRDVHKIDHETIARFVGFLKAYKTNILPADVVAHRIAELLKDYPDLVRDFNKFLPIPKADMVRERAPRDKEANFPQKRRRTSADIALENSNNEWRHYHQQHQQRHAFSRQPATYDDDYYHHHQHQQRKYYAAYGIHRIGGPEWLSMKASNRGEHDCRPLVTPMVPEEPQETDAHRVDLSNGVYCRPSDDVDENMMHGERGFVGDGVVSQEFPKESSSFAFADVWSEDDFDDINDEDREDPEEDLVDLLITKTEDSKLPQNRHAVTPHRHDPPSAARTKVNAAVEDAIKNVTAKAASLEPEVMRDYEKMKDLAYEAWERFKYDIYSFDAFAGIILDANRGISSSNHLGTLSKMLENLKCLFNVDADDFIDKLIDAQPENAKRHMTSLRASWH